jgi:glycosyltransferase involved in cell wall biosynthesis
MPERSVEHCRGIRRSDAEAKVTHSTSSRLRILALEPYSTLSHLAFLEGFRKHSRHEVVLWTLPPRKWKWRMRGSAYHFASLARAYQDREQPDVVLASDYLNLADWHALAPAGWRDAPSLLYFHENQITYPLGREAPVDFHYGWINLSSALAADRVLFNSAYHRTSFLDEVQKVLARMPEPVPHGMVGDLQARSAVFPVGIDFEAHRAILREPRRENGQPPVIVWNHRWEEDKDPDLLVDALAGLIRRGVEFRAVICGQSFPVRPPAFDKLPALLGERLLHFGFFPDAGSYLRALRDANVVLSTARHEFFGVAVVEALFLGCVPVLPAALSYPEILPEPFHEKLLYARREDVVATLEDALLHPPEGCVEVLQKTAAEFDWALLAPRLDAILDDTARERRA